MTRTLSLPHTYNQVFRSLFTRSQYADVICQGTRSAEEISWEINISSQLYYLQAISAGHNETVAAFQG